LTNDRRGLTAFEYGLIAALLGVLLVTAMATLGSCR
jgi:Flp pilus assembly pilin Flp